jgi:hypothetical protein
MIGKRVPQYFPGPGHWGFAALLVVAATARAIAVVRMVVRIINLSDFKSEGAQKSKKDPRLTES